MLYFVCIVYCLKLRGVLIYLAVKHDLNYVSFTSISTCRLLICFRNCCELCSTCFYMNVNLVTEPVQFIQRFSNFWRFGITRKLIFFSKHMANFIPEKYSVLQILTKTWLVSYS